MVKLRHIAYQSARYNHRPIWGVTIPDEIVVFFQGTTFTKVYKSGAALILESGTTHAIPHRIIKDYKFEDVRI